MLFESRLHSAAIKSMSCPAELYTRLVCTRRDRGPTYKGGGGQPGFGGFELWASRWNKAGMGREKGGLILSVLLLHSRGAACTAEESPTA